MSLVGVRNFVFFIWLASTVSIKPSLVANALQSELFSSERVVTEDGLSEAAGLQRLLLLFLLGVHHSGRPGSFTAGFLRRVSELDNFSC